MNIRFHPLHTTEVLNSQSALIVCINQPLQTQFLSRNSGSHFHTCAGRWTTWKKKKQLHQQKAHPAFVKTWATASRSSWHNLQAVCLVKESPLTRNCRRLYNCRGGEKPIIAIIVTIVKITNYLRWQKLSVCAIEYHLIINQNETVSFPAKWNSKASC